ncbi:MAG: conjugal transfer protein TraJ [Rhodospirillaceae bacterium]|nr:MAG: conjugal transfer protein TraJ [Rhodospirillaceae bacterium]
MAKTKRKLVGGWLLPEEKSEVQALARQARLTTSELVRRLVLGRKLPDVHHHEATLNLLKINADLARFGNLLRMALRDDNLGPATRYKLNALLDNSRATQDILKMKITNL